MVAVREEFDRDFVGAYQAYTPMLQRRARRWLPPDEIDDAIQETFLRAWAHHHGRDPGIPWLLTVLRNLAIDRSRRHRPEPVGDMELLDTPHEDGPEQKVIALDERRAVRNALRGLTESQQAVMQLREWEGMSHQQIAASLGTTVPSVESLLVRGRRRLRGALEKVLGVAMWPAAGLWRRLRPLSESASGFSNTAPVAVSSLSMTVAQLATAAVVIVAGVATGPSLPGGGNGSGSDRPAIVSTSGHGGSGSSTMEETRFLNRSNGGSGPASQAPSGGVVAAPTSGGSAAAPADEPGQNEPEGPGKTKVDPNTSAPSPEGPQIGGGGGAETPADPTPEEPPTNEPETPGGPNLDGTPLNTSIGG